MKIIVGLGNPDAKYDGTRHNAGFSVVTELSDRLNIPFNKKECKSVTGHGFIGTEKVVLAKPMTYMNLSGEAVSELLHFYKCDIRDLIVIYDDKDLPLGTIRVRHQGSAGSHNGMRSIVAMIGGTVFDRVRVGLGERPDYMSQVDFVLGRFTDEELPTVRRSVSMAADAVIEIVEQGVESAMNKYNKVHGD